MQPPSHHDSGHSGAGAAAGPSSSTSNHSGTAKNSNGSNVSNAHHEGGGNNNSNSNSTAVLPPPPPAASSTHTAPLSSGGGGGSHKQHARASSLVQTQNRNAQNGHHGHSLSVGSEKGVVVGMAGNMATGMGDGILNQSMKADLENWLAALKLSPDSPVHVVGFFGQTNDLSMFERVSSSESESSCNFENDRVVVYHDESLDGQASFNLGLNEPKTTGDIHIYVDRSKNTIMLQHAYLYDTQEMLSACLESMDMVKKDRASLMKWLHDQEFESHRALLFLFLVTQVIVYTSPDMNLDPQMISVLSALSTIKRQIMQELDRFMAICWDRIGVLSPEHHQQNGNGGGGGGHSGRGANSMASIFTPGKCVPVLVFVIERVPVVAPWHEYGASDNQIVEHLKNQVLKKSIDALQTRLRYIFRACRLIQSIDPPAGAFDARQLFVLPGPSSTPFVHVIPHFIGQLDLSDGINSVDDSVLDPAEAVLRQKKTKGHPKKQGPGVNAKNAFMRDNNNNKKSTKNTSSVVAADDDSIFRTPTLKEIYSGVVLARDQPLKQLGINLAGGNSSGSGSSSSNDGTLGESPPLSTLSLGSLYLDFTGPLLKQFVDGWVTNITSPGGYGNTIGKRNTGSVEIPSMKQWMAGLLGVCESLGVTSFSSPVVNRDLGPSITLSSDDLLLNEQEQSSTKENAIGGNKGSKSHSGSTGGRRSGAGKKYSLRCAHLVQKKIQDYIQTDDVMEELYGQKAEVPTTTARTHSERYHQLRADHANKLFQSLAHRR